MFVLPLERPRKALSKLLLILGPLMLVSLFWATSPSGAHEGTHQLSWQGQVAGDLKSPQPSPIARWEAQGTAVGGKLYVFGGYYTSDRTGKNDPNCARICATKASHVYDPAATAAGIKSWTRIADMPEPLTHAATVVDGDTIWLIGGFLGDFPGPSTDHVWKYDTKGNTWSAGPSLPEVQGSGAAVLVGRTIHFLGGVGEDGQVTFENQNDHWTLDLSAATPTWTRAPDLPRARNHPGAAFVDGKIFVVGGRTGGDVAGQSGEVNSVDI